MAVDVDGLEDQVAIDGSIVSGPFNMQKINGEIVRQQENTVRQAMNQQPISRSPNTPIIGPDPHANESPGDRQARLNAGQYNQAVAEGQRKGEATHPFVYGGGEFGYGFARTTAEGLKQLPGVVLPEMAIGKLGQLYNEYQLYKYYKGAVKTLDVATDANQAVFYSGPGNRALAMEFAEQNGKKTIDMTAGGKWLNEQNLYDFLPRGMADDIWKDLSKRFADDASGQVTGFVKGARPDRVFESVEYPTLLKNKKVTNVITGGN
jgi:hypothetical protein